MVKRPLIPRGGHPLGRGSLGSRRGALLWGSGGLRVAETIGGLAAAVGSARSESARPRLPRNRRRPARLGMVNSISVAGDALRSQAAGLRWSRGADPPKGQWSGGAEKGGSSADGKGWTLARLRMIGSISMAGSSLGSRAAGLQWPRAMTSQAEQWSGGAGKAGSGAGGKGRTSACPGYGRFDQGGGLFAREPSGPIAAA